MSTIQQESVHFISGEPDMDLRRNRHHPGNRTDRKAAKFAARFRGENSPR